MTAQHRVLDAVRLRARAASQTIGRRFRELALLCLAACDGAGPEARNVGPDATVAACEPGENACACTNSGRCRDDLFCISGRCLAAEGPSLANEPSVMRPPLRPIQPASTVTARPQPPDADAAPDVGDSTAPPDSSASGTDASTTSDASTDGD